MSYMKVMVVDPIPGSDLLCCVPDDLPVLVDWISLTDSAQRQLMAGRNLRCKSYVSACRAELRACRKTFFGHRDVVALPEQNRLLLKLILRQHPLLPSSQQ